MYRDRDRQIKKKRGQIEQPVTRTPHFFTTMILITKPTKDYL